MLVGVGEGIGVGQGVDDGAGIVGVADGSGVAKGLGVVSGCVQATNRKAKAIGKEIAQIRLPSSDKAPHLGEEVAEDHLMATIVDLVTPGGHLLRVDPHVG